ncbi:AraC family transcriptional regulator [Sediminibacterium soli]|uniref:AraC family transcriptional regulator n=1 Tax=Sediminibacterium soli TaxID=2698829 RepID=UPI00137ACDC2|nr:helix-turn-helix domain-containing protein [Sediminibacterium soli]NCI46772.1 helix-turn-helix domain-containing protein [Sediminibacterium soli]
MVLHIKNMVCDRCIMAVRNELEKLPLPYSDLRLGEVTVAADPGPDTLQRFAGNLRSLGFELLDDQRSQTVERIKNTIINLVHRSGEVSNLKLSAILEQELGMDYHYLTTLFSSVEAMTIEKFAILQRIERVKELLTYNELALGEIADQLGYSSPQHLSQQFKKTTGMTPSQFRGLTENTRQPLDKLKG